MDTTRQSILDHAARLAVSQGEVPSLNILAAAVGISKGGLMHHFPTRDALLTALAIDGIAEVDAAMNLASGRTETLRAWLALSIPDENGIALFQAMASVFFAGKSDDATIQKLGMEATSRWESRLKSELGSSEAARVALLLGDGLLFGAISGNITSKNSAGYLLTAEAAVAAVMKASK